MKYKVLITTSGIGSRLGDLTDFTNKSLVRIGDKPAISHIIDMYPVDTNFVITLGHYGEYVQEYINIAHPDCNVTFVWVDKFTGPGTSLAYSIIQAKEELQCPFVFNACDTLLKDNINLLGILEKEQNFCVGAKREDTSQYATLLIERDNLLQIKEKGEINYDFAYIGLCGIKDYELFWKNIEEAYNQDRNNSFLHEGNIINTMLSEVQFKFFSTNGWLDIGNVGELEKTRKYFKSEIEVLEKKEESIYFFDEYVVKFFHDKKINSNRIQRASHLSGLTPEIIDSGENFYKYKKVKGDLLAKSVTESSFEGLLLWAKENLWVKQECENMEQLCYDFYIKKSLKRIDAYLDGKSDVEEKINGELIPSVKELFARIDIKKLCSGIPVRFHGDFILDNILETDTGFCLLDWRQDFGGDLSVGDIYYDLAKLNHNLTINHEIVNKKLFNHEAEDCYILCNSKLIECKSILKKFVLKNGLDYGRINLLTAIIWINMAPLHEYPFSKFLYNFGKYNLNKALNCEN